MVKSPNHSVSTEVFAKGLSCLPLCSSWSWTHSYKNYNRTVVASLSTDFPSALLPMPMTSTVSATASRPLQKQFSVIQTFSKSNAIRINPSKTEVVRFSAQECTTEYIVLEDQPLAVRPAAKCLGYWWHSSFFPAMSINENIAKARRAYFTLGSIGAYQGQLNPLFGRDPHPPLWVRKLDSL